MKDDRPLRPLEAMIIKGIGYDHKGGLLTLTFTLDEEAKRTADYLHYALRYRIPVWLEYQEQDPENWAGPVFEGEVIEDAVQIRPPKALPVRSEAEDCAAFRSSLEEAPEEVG